MEYLMKFDCNVQSIDITHKDIYGILDLKRFNKLQKHSRCESRHWRGNAMHCNNDIK